MMLVNVALYHLLLGKTQNLLKFNIHCLIYCFQQKGVLFYLNVTTTGLNNGLYIQLAFLDLWLSITYLHFIERVQTASK